MLKTQIILGTMLSVIMIVTACKQDETIPELTNEQKVTALLGAFATGNPDALQHISDVQYKQHSPFFPDGKAALEPFFNGQPTGITTTLHRIFSEGNYVITHTTYGGAWNNGSPQVAFDIFRFDNGLIMEHWDNLQQITNPAEDLINGNTQTNGTTFIELGDVAANKALVTNMVNNILIAGQWSTRANYFSNNYLQHSPGVPNGIDWMAMFPDGTPFYAALKFVYGAGNFVFTMSEGPEFVNNAPTGNQKAYFDLFRMQNGKIAEHWDAVSTIPPANQWANANGKW